MDTVFEVTSISGSSGLSQASEHSKPAFYSNVDAINRATRYVLLGYF